MSSKKSVFSNSTLRSELLGTRKFKMPHFTIICFKKGRQILKNEKKPNEGLIVYENLLTTETFLRFPEKMQVLLGFIRNRPLKGNIFFNIQKGQKQNG